MERHRKGALGGGRVRHAICLDCGTVVHVPVTFASSRSASARLEGEAWALRLMQGCRECGGRLSSLHLEPCNECERFVARWAE